MNMNVSFFFFNMAHPKRPKDEIKIDVCVRAVKHIGYDEGIGGCIDLRCMYA